jgi:hypothetical protein
MFYHSKRWKSKLPSISPDPIIFRGEATPNKETDQIDFKYIDKASRMLSDPTYKQRVKRVLSIMQRGHTSTIH